MTDNLTRAQRSYCMSRVRTKDTDLEGLLTSALRRHGLRFARHDRRLPGSPDIVFPRSKVAVFVDGDFWHGYRFPSWRATMSAFWRVKIAKNRRRDARNFQKLRREGWQVVRIWQHQVRANLEGCVARVLLAVRAGG
jgi:DNA mismatch endonuclease (patch repair protein)